MSDHGTAPIIPTALQQYNSYVEDPIWQRRFTIIWGSLLGAAILFSLPHLARSIRSGRAFNGLFGISEDLSGKHYSAVVSEETTLPRRRNRKLEGSLRMMGSFLYWSPPGLELNAGQILVILGYLSIVLVCIIVNAPLIDNPNRAGFLALAQFPVVFLFATKNSLVSLLLGPGNGYERLNYIHRWSGRCMFIGAAVHGTLWINNHIVWNLPILSQQKEGSGVAAFAVLCLIVLTSLKPVRRYFYEVFYVIHILSFVAFFITVCYHTIYAAPWIFPPLAFYGLDMLMRLFRVRIKDATLIPVDNQMTLIRIPDCDGGWQAGQHVKLRVFFSGRMFESHPLTITNAPPSTTCQSATGITLGARVSGDWTRALNLYAQAEKQALIATSPSEKEQHPTVEVPIQVMIDGPYGGCSIDLGRYESVLLFAGGSGVTFTIGLLDDIVGRCVKLGRGGGEITRRIEFAWCVRSFGSIEWFAPTLMDIATTVAASTSLDLHISIYVTCLCNPEAVPPIPNCDVTIIRPSVHQLLRELVTQPSSTSSSSPSIVDGKSEGVNVDCENIGELAPRLGWTGVGGGVGVCASGPERLTREASNAVARMNMTRGVELGGIALHTELFSI